MIDRVSEFGTSVAQPLAEGDNTHKTAGDLLREAREAHGLHIEMVAAALKVPPQKLLALEADDIASLPDPVFARALASSVCRALRIDPAPVLAKLPTTQRVSLAEADRTLKTNISSGTPRWSSNSSRSSGLPSRALLTVVLLLLIGAGALFWLPQSVFDQIGATVARLTAHSGSDNTNSTGEAPAGGSAAPSAPGTVAESVPAQIVAPGGPVGAVGAASAAAPATAPGTVGAGAAAAPLAAASAPAAAAANSGQQLVFVAREECWVTVSEAGGKQLLRRSLKAGETLGLSGTLPLSVVIGRASSVDVQVRGQPFDLKPVTKGGGVARFEVK
ncbi:MULTISPECIES: helix-turn-helix domain-containing protein [unclassified Variovorax]|uniref:helix-turn-helix domain-containing protein n=1 Tax=unclassified Variovorax TaxID=663243 RepID=UPI0008BAFBE6|nr:MULTISPECIES: helix-turn-helix domain-containing protein [unclassified Variovorax]SEK06688.1 cytoskeleton protein RodZ [Variovorax sp. OK202]SFD47483.1 cytoskeleton protein RodZ [Variovorax sp. OK212]